ncbi:mannose-1-phosphate guanylyltransferase [bacterium]|nr:mannose-1-phosphate guanylyltransferase [bacterium]
MVYAVIMAGGKGTRFWPVSTPERPKQLLRLFDERTMIEQTVHRLEPFIPADQQFIVTIEEQIEEFARQVPDLDRNSFITEPFARNTGPAIGLSAVHLLKKDPDAIMVVLPADHRIEDKEAFQATLRTAVGFVEESDGIVTIGIRPTRPETGYGYIQYERDDFRPGVHRVVTFAEKPNRETAIRFIETGEFLWNSGMFIWSAQRILSEIEEHTPELYAALMEISDALDTDAPKERVVRAYQSIKPISIDYGVMEKTRNAYVVPAGFGWSDIGSWEEVYQMDTKDTSGNVRQGPVVILDTQNSYVVSRTELPLAVIGMKNVVVVHTEEGTLVCPRDRLQDVREAAELVQKRKH